MKFATPSETEAAFYESFSKGNLEEMKEIWLDSPSVICTHPMAQRIVGHRLIIGSYMGMFKNQGPLTAVIEQVETLQTKGLSVHTGVEVIHQDAMEFRMQVTNVYRSTEDGWRHGVTPRLAYSDGQTHQSN